MRCQGIPTASCTNDVYATPTGSANNAPSEARRGITMNDREAFARATARLDRRAFVTRAGLLAAGISGASLLAACTSTSPGAPSAPTAAGGAAKPAAAGASGGPVKPPTYVPFTGPKPDLAGNEQGLDPAFYKFPTDLVSTVTT